MTKRFQALVAPVALFGFALAGCQSQAQKEVKEQAEAIEESADADADLMEARALGGPDEKAVRNQAEALRNEGEQTREKLDAMAEELD